MAICRCIRHACMFLDVKYIVLVWYCAENPDMWIQTERFRVESSVFQLRNEVEGF
jgi:hypothetical protein